MTLLRTLAAAACTLALLAAAPALAIDLDTAKTSGLVGEQLDDYVGLVNPGAPQEVKALVDDVNGKRRDHYQEIARRNGTEVRAVAALAGAKLVEKAPAGQWVKDSTGRWVLKE